VTDEKQIRNQGIWVDGARVACALIITPEYQYAPFSNKLFLIRMKFTELFVLRIFKNGDGKR